MDKLGRNGEKRVFCALRKVCCASDRVAVALFDCLSQLYDHELMLQSMKSLKCSFQRSTYEDVSMRYKSAVLCGSAHPSCS